MRVRCPECGYTVSVPIGVVTMRSIIALHTAPSIPGCSKPWVRARRASLALLLLRFRRDETRNDALRRHETAQASQFASYLTASRSLNPLPAGSVQPCLRLLRYLKFSDEISSLPSRWAGTENYVSIGRPSLATDVPMNLLDGGTFITRARPRPSAARYCRSGNRSRLARSSPVDRAAARP
jgi:hypothetical protein